MAASLGIPGVVSDDSAGDFTVGMCPDDEMDFWEELRDFTDFVDMARVAFLEPCLVRRQNDDVRFFPCDEGKLFSQSLLLTSFMTICPESVRPTVYLQ